MNADWVDRKEKIGNLNLDLQNPRVPKHIKNTNDVDQIRNYLIEKTDVLQIAGGIADIGYHRSATAIVCEEEGELVVLDGNRRLAACQLLLNPALSPPAYRKHFEQFSKQCDKAAFAEVKITIAPSRKAAEKEIWDIHVNPLLKPWQVLQKLRMYRNLIDDDEYNVDEAAAEYPLHAFWRSVVYKTEEFCRRISSVPLTVEEWQRQKEILSRPWEFDQIDVGFSVFYLNRCNRSGIIHHAGLIGGINQSGKWKMDARYDRAKLVERVEAIGQRHGSITLRNWDAERFIKEHLPTLPERSLVYFDPPYFRKAEGLYYDHYSPKDHKRIADFIQQNVKQFWVVSYDGVKQILNYYSNRNQFRYRLQYNARKVYKGTEALFFSDYLKLPKTSIVPCIEKALNKL